MNKPDIKQQLESLLGFYLGFYQKKIEAIKVLLEDFPDADYKNIATDSQKDIDNRGTSISSKKAAGKNAIRSAPAADEEKKIVMTQRKDASGEYGANKQNEILEFIRSQ